MNNEQFAHLLEGLATVTNTLQTQTTCSKDVISKPEAVRATPETAEDLTHSIPAGEKSKDIFNSVENKYSPAGGKSKEKKLKGNLLHGALSVHRGHGKEHMTQLYSTKPPHSHIT
ncbi:hypothetical protein L218DRAFT_948058 [Marasmius fiardii PR-910]|nr:hypothetical protein L218DRAFT_948058 [Marasmius fiardii PR-910]